uniref:F-box domain-containing protein n=1 Tax=Mycena chlorophos TaxID=658473 RepID=A0ABQ0KWX2_MYCCL|nr:predicted protein [Mycena chlorophos]
MAGPHLAQELLDLIVSFLPIDAAVVCARTARRLQSGAEKIIFRDLSVDGRNIGALIDAFASRDTRVQAVRSLEIASYIDDSLPSFRTLSETRYPWSSLRYLTIPVPALSAEAQVCEFAALPMLSRLHGLRLRFTGGLLSLAVDIIRRHIPPTVTNLGIICPRRLDGQLASAEGTRVLLHITHFSLESACYTLDQALAGAHSTVLDRSNIRGLALDGTHAKLLRNFPAVTSLKVGQLQLNPFDDSDMIPNIVDLTVWNRDTLCYVLYAYGAAMSRLSTVHWRYVGPEGPEPEHWHSSEQLILQIAKWGAGQTRRLPRLVIYVEEYELQYVRRLFRNIAASGLVDAEACVQRGLTKYSIHWDHGTERFMTLSTNAG